MTPAVAVPIPEPQRKCLAVLAKWIDEGTYLAGGVAVAALLHHRASRDLDLFVPHDFEPERFEERLSAGGAAARIVGRARGTLHLELDGIPVSVLSYRYLMLAAPLSVDGLALPIASPADLACMKLSAIAGRGAAKDFWDLDGLLELGVAGGSLSGALELYAQKFPIEDVGHVVRSLAYFGDADAAPLPNGLSPSEWGRIKAAFQRRLKALP